jgi:hypothetical protein
MHVQPGNGFSSNRFKDGWESLQNRSASAKEAGKKLRRRADKDDDDEFEEDKDLFRENSEFFSSDE